MKLRNIAIIAHVDHGKTTLVDQLLRQSGEFAAHERLTERVMDSEDQERERGITILAKNTAITWNDWRINIVDTPGHADFGGEVERVLSMVDSVLLLVDAVDGPMPQTRFVTQKAFAMGFRPIVVINKIDRPGARPDWVLNQTFDLFDKLGATDEQLDFPVLYASGLNGYAGLDESVRGGDLTPLFEALVEHVPEPPVDPDGPFQMQVTSLSYSTYVGLIGIGRIRRGRVKTNQPVAVIDREGKRRSGRVLQVLGFSGLKREEIPEAGAGDIIGISGIENIGISDTLCDPAHPEALPPLSVDEPTIHMTFQVNDSPFAGREGKFLTSRQIRARLYQEASHNVALQVADTSDPDQFEVSGRGELHLSVLIETMRREGYELAVSRPRVRKREVDGEMLEPWESVVLDMEEEYQGAVMQAMGERKAQLKDMVPDGKGRVRLDYIAPARGLIGFQSSYRTMTAGTGLFFRVFDHWGPATERIAARINGTLISMDQGTTVAYSLFNLQDRGKLFVGAGEDVYEGMIIGLHSRENDLVVNPLKKKQLTNIRAAGKDDALLLTPPIRMSLEQALEFLADDELLEVTPEKIRLRKRLLKEHERKRAERSA
ncbi:translational GTPase TypA [Wenzhouxiangella marina]|uniref:Large ribosomal subunit assembly factor BipA n=1 Tax=Wenzhouxiangella marina TaxID=1579979 RepID=A0A0K0XX81_9GAMM|nr:translational GTPase TypA [Wenzhouxiangella marina]AKS42293.1 GTP-binding elongation factor family protein with P-loop containing NTP hydrolase domain [Wenzhouxiangella marina]MBB6085934.1 GTP-binding protein [Wenzhouxiangella marina]